MLTVVLHYLRLREVEQGAVIEHRGADDRKGVGSLLGDLSDLGVLACNHLLLCHRFGGGDILIGAGECVLDVALIDAQHDGRGGVLVPAIAVDLCVDGRILYLLHLSCGGLALLLRLRLVGGAVRECASCDDQGCGCYATCGDQGVPLSSWAERVFQHLLDMLPCSLVAAGFGERLLGRRSAGELVALVERDQRIVDIAFAVLNALLRQGLLDTALCSLHLRDLGLICGDLRCRKLLGCACLPLIGGRRLQLLGLCLWIEARLLVVLFHVSHSFRFFSNRFTVCLFVCF